MSAPEPRVRRGGTARDVLLSLAVLLIPIVVIVAITRACTTIAVVDPSGAAGEARAAGRFEVLVPQGLPSGWRSVRAAYTEANGTGTLRVGYLTPGGGAVQLLETNEDPQVVLPREFGDRAEPAGTVDIGGTSWRAYRVRAGQERALVVTSGARTTLVQGQASDAELRELAASLR